MNNIGFILQAEKGMPGGVPVLDNNGKIENINLGYDHTQSTPVSIWEINHKLDRFPNVVIVDSAGTKVEGDVKYIDSDNVKLIFGAAFAGTAYLN